eukprot:CAMPEP_0113580380 /NCGR_PEP_ID=MMETSP0015_2-20120614/30639_1 /TAXON_ID=2838 /ORGANISM="Odontella" /LENGTH=307 /DNA_ID=CAMNT_0000484559 /DNA_START=56 /DNA_END=977 /DNA_ORIENTATION=+ /assembly_acc=CAM_ASM_000160
MTADAGGAKIISWKKDEVHHISRPYIIPNPTQCLASRGRKDQAVDSAHHLQHRGGDDLYLIGAARGVGHVDAKKRFLGRTRPQTIPPEHEETQMKPADRRRCLTERAAEAAITEEVMKAARAAGVNISTGWGLSNGKKKGRGVGKQDEKEEAERRRRAEEIKAVTAEVRGAALSAVVDLSEDGDGDGCDVDDAVEAGSSSLHPPLSRPAAASEAVAVAPQPRPPGPKLTLKKRRSRPQKKKRVCPGGSSVAANPAPPVIVPSGLHRASSMETAASATTPDLSSSASSLASLQAKSPPPLPLRPRSIA